MADTTQYDTIGIREDLINVIAIISPDDTPKLSMFGRAQATQTLHEWQTFDLAAAAANAQVESSDATFVSLPARARLSNRTQMLRKTFSVSDTLLATTVAGVSNEFSWRKMIAMRELGTDIEFAITNGTLVTGDNSTARQMQGVRDFISTNVASSASERDLTEALLNDSLQTLWEAGGKPDVIVAAGFQARRIANFTSNTREIQAEKKMLVNAVTMYQSMFGIVRVVLDRYWLTTGIGILETAKWRTAWLRPLRFKPIATLGSSQRGMLEAELTLESLQEKASAEIINLTTA